ncbi:histone deacetylase family protein [Idiomarina sp. ST10R2A5]|uniref:histone deacetylase family protein n=1 Tax=Idiomarina sp. ST10R2A5 TaxID=3418368 RepID=UPI003EC5716C
MKKVDVPFIYSPIYSELNLPPRHRYPIEKYRLLKNWAIKHGAKEHQWHKPSALSWQQVGRTHCSGYIEQLRQNSMEKTLWRRIGFPWSESLLQRTLTSAGGTLLTTELALTRGIAIHFSGGYHHAHKDWGSGFCLINDLAIACNELLLKYPSLKIAILDTDVHQGDGTATLFANDDRVFTCSLHGERNFPFSKVESDLDKPLAKHTSDQQYLDTLQETLQFIKRDVKPDLILYDAGVDIYQRDELGHLNISLAGIFQRDLSVLGFAKCEDIPLAAVIGGGYQRNLDRLVRAHAQLLRASYHVYTESQLLTEGKTYEV